MLFVFDNSMDIVSKASFRFAGTYGGANGFACGDDSPAEFGIGLGPYDVQPVPEAGIPIDPATDQPAAHYVAAVKPGMWHFTAVSPELGVTVVCDRPLDYAVSGQIIMRAQDPTSSTGCF